MRKRNPKSAITLVRMTSSVELARPIAPILNRLSGKFGVTVPLALGSGVRGRHSFGDSFTIGMLVDVRVGIGVGGITSGKRQGSNPHKIKPHTIEPQPFQEAMRRFQVGTRGEEPSYSDHTVLPPGNYKGTARI